MIGSPIPPSDGRGAFAAAVDGAACAGAERGRHANAIYAAAPAAATSIATATHTPTGRVGESVGGDARRFDKLIVRPLTERARNHAGRQVGCGAAENQRQERVRKDDLPPKVATWQRRQSCY